jgi:hypothetical protein
MNTEAHAHEVLVGTGPYLACGTPCELERGVPAPEQVLKRRPPEKGPSAEGRRSGDTGVERPRPRLHFLPAAALDLLP